MRIILFSLSCFVLFGLSVNAQKLIVSESVSLYSDDPEIEIIKGRWEEYFMLAGKRDSKSQEQAVERYWNKEKDTFGDINKNDYGFGHHVTFSIRKLDLEFYEITSVLSPWPDNIMKVYSVLAKKEMDEYRLYNYFDWTKRQLINYSTDYIDYYYHAGYDFDQEKATSTNGFISRFIHDYKIAFNSKAVYLVAGNLTDIHSILGFGFSLYHSTNSFAGVYFEPCIIASLREDHIHELVHFFMKPAFPDAPDLLHEGIATYYGGSSGRDWQYHKEHLSGYLTEYPHADLSDFDSLNKLINVGHDLTTNPFYTVGAMLIDAALRIGGESKVIELFGHTNLYEMFKSCFGVSHEDIDKYIKELLSI